VLIEQVRLARVSQIQLNPDASRITVKMTVQDLFEFAVKSATFVFETDSEYLLLGELLLVSDKKEVKRARYLS
jgi:hypothetical protein